MEIGRKVNGLAKAGNAWRILAVLPVTENIHMAWSETSRARYRHPFDRIESGLTGEEWELIERIPPSASMKGCPRSTDLRFRGQVPPLAGREDVEPAVMLPAVGESLRTQSRKFAGEGPAFGVPFPDANGGQGSKRLKTKDAMLPVT